MSQNSLDFQRTHARTTDPQTSKDAAAVAAKASGSVKQQILAVMLRLGRPISTEELQDELPHIRPDSVWKRVSDLKREHVIEESTLTHRTRGGAKAAMWRLKA